MSDRHWHVSNILQEWINPTWQSFYSLKQPEVRGSAMLQTYSIMKQIFSQSPYETQESSFLTELVMFLCTYTCLLGSAARWINISICTEILSAWKQ